MARQRADRQLTEAVQFFYGKDTKFKQVQAQYKEYKSEFEEKMLAHFDSLGRGRKSVKFAGGSTARGNIVVSKVERTTIEWLPEKLKRRTPKELHKQLFKKRYEIADIKGLTSYLKSCGVDPKVFKAFLSVEETVDEKAVARLGDTGELTVGMVSGCYTVHCQKPYFALKVERADGEYEAEDD